MITVDRKQFTRAIALAQSVVERRSTIPVLTGLKVVANGSLSLQGSDLDTCTTVELDYIGKEADFILENPPAVSAAVNAAGAAEVQLNIGEATEGERAGLYISSGALAADLKSNFPADDHPGADRIAFEEFGADIGPEVLAQLARITRAISMDEIRYYLNGVCVKKVGDWTWRLATSDGHRLMMVDVPLPNATGELPDNTIIPRRWVNIALQHFRKSKEGARLSFGRTAIRNQESPTLDLQPGSPRIGISAQLDAKLRFSLTSKLIDGTYPDYMRIVPTEHRLQAMVERRKLAQAIQSLTPFGDGKVRAVKLLLEPGINEMKLKLASPHIGSAAIAIPCQHNATEPLDIGFNGQYLLDMCNAITGDEMQFGLTDKLFPTTIIDPADTAWKGVLMPMRV